MDKFVVGERCKISEGVQEAVKAFHRAGFEWKQKYKRYLGQWAEIYALFVDDSVMLRMENGKEYKFPLSCIHREGVTNLVQDDAETNWPKEVVRNHEEQLLEQIEKLQKNEMKDQGESDSDRSASDSVRFKAKKKRESVSNSNPIFNVGDKVFAKFKDEKQQGTVTAVQSDREAPFEVYLDNVGLTYRMKPNELEICERPQAPPPDQELIQFLKSFNLGQYLKGLIDEGFESVGDLENAEMEDLKAAGLKRGHIRRLMRAVRESQANPTFGFEEINYQLQKRPSFVGHRDSLMHALQQRPETDIISQLSQPVNNFGQENQVGIGSVAPVNNQPFQTSQDFQSYHQLTPTNLQDYQQPSINQFANVRRASSSNISSIVQSPQPMHQRRRSSIWEFDGHLVVKFVKRPLGFGIMAPLFVGTMVSTINDQGLKEKGLGLGLPLLSVNDIDVANEILGDVAKILSLTELPFSITFGLQPYFRAGQKVIVSKNKKWYPAVVLKMSKTTRKVTVKYEGSPFLFSNTEKIADYNRIRKPNHFQNLDQNKNLQLGPQKPGLQEEEYGQSAEGIANNPDDMNYRKLIQGAYINNFPTNAEAYGQQVYLPEYPNMPSALNAILQGSDTSPQEINYEQAKELQYYPVQENQHIEKEHNTPAPI